MLEHIILHIPHTGLDLPASYLGDILVPENMVRQNAFHEADMFVDQLFDMAGIPALIPQFSRYVCDVERFRDDSKEAESRRGRGLCYTHFDDGRQFRQYNPELRQRVLTELYDPHHVRFAQAVASKLQVYGQCCIIDCHSYPDKEGYPDFCIGTDNFHTPAALREQLQNFMEKAGYGVQVNFPYSGSIVPMAYYQTDNRVKSIMIEVNKRLYMDEAAFQQNSKFHEIGRLCREMVALLAAHGDG
jgi:N-formylglutamate amidohydrolase